MAKKTTQGRRVKVDRWQEAADRARVPIEEFRLWALRSLRGVNPKQWSHWDTGERRIPERIIIDFLLDQREASEKGGEATASRG